MLTSDGTWITENDNIVGVRVSTDHYNSFSYRTLVLKNGESADIASRSITWGPDGSSVIKSERRITNDAALRGFLAGSDLVAQNGGIWLNDVPESVAPRIED